MIRSAFNADVKRSVNRYRRLARRYLRVAATLESRAGGQRALAAHAGPHTARIAAAAADVLDKRAALALDESDKWSESARLVLLVHAEHAAAVEGWRVPSVPDPVLSGA